MNEHQSSVIIKVDDKNLDTDTDTDTYIAIVNQLFEKYDSNPYMKSRLEQHLKKLPLSLELEDSTNQKRILRTTHLTNEQCQFTQIFLYNNKYYYLPTSECFYHYDNKTYRTIKEDVILHNLLSSIRKEGQLTDWKYKVKIQVMKKIKERNLFHSIPESYTIQRVLNTLCPSIFSDRLQAKYFLTVLGDNILKKNPELIFISKPKSRKYLQELDNVMYNLTGINSNVHNFVTKFHDSYQYSQCRLVKMNNTLPIELWKEMLIERGLDIVCVAVHYSRRYECSDNYILGINNNNNNNNNELLKYTLTLKNSTLTDIINRFREQYIQSHNIGILSKSSQAHSITSSNGVGVCTYEDSTLSLSSSPPALPPPPPHSSSPSPSLHPPTPTNTLHKSKFIITWKNMHYIWKLYISHYSIPSVVYSNTLKQLLKDIYSFDEEMDTFYNVTSKYLPCVSDFIRFWENTITIIQQPITVSSLSVSSNADVSVDADTTETCCELEIDEISVLFKKWNRENTNIDHYCCNGNITETDIIKIINHFFPTIEVVDNKYILKISSSQWNKQYEVRKSLMKLKEHYYSKYKNTMISFDDAYHFYCKHNKNKVNVVGGGGGGGGGVDSINMSVSKRFFEKIIVSTMSEYIEHDAFISSSWYLQ